MRALFALALLAACGEGGVTVKVTLTASTVDVLDPYAASTGISKVRIRIDGVDQHDDATRDLGLAEREATFEAFPKGSDVVIRADGYDEFGNVVAFGRAERLTIEDDLAVTIQFRRNLAYVIHDQLAGQREPGAHIYVIDVSSRTRVAKLRLPGAAPRARGIAARGGDSILVTYDDGAQSFVGVISADTHEIRQLPLMRSQSIVVASPASKTAVVAGGGAISFLDLDSGTNEVFAMQVGGELRDAAMSPDGTRAIVVLKTAALDVNVDRREVEQIPILPDASGVAIGFGGRVAYLTSSTEGSVGQISLDNEEANVIPGSAFVRPVMGAAYSDEMNAIFGVNVNESNGSSRVISFVVLPEPLGLALDEGTQSLNYATGIAADGPGRRIVVVAAGTSTDTAGLTVIDTFPDRIPDGSSTLYPLDPDDTYVSPKGTTLRQRWRPIGVAVIYGR